MGSKCYLTILDICRGILITLDNYSKFIYSKSNSLVTSGTFIGRLVF